MDAVHRHVNHLDLAVDGEDLLDVFLQKARGRDIQTDLYPGELRHISPLRELRQ